MTRRRTGTVTVTGIARAHRSGLTRGAGALSIAAVAVLLAGCATSDDGVVLEGADGNNYVVPDGAERPQYATREDCIADVTEQISKLQAQGESIGDDPNTLCEESSRYPSAHYAYPFVGPIIFAGSRWDSPRVSGWSDSPVGVSGPPVRASSPMWFSQLRRGRRPVTARRSRAGSAPRVRADSGSRRAAEELRAGNYRQKTVQATVDLLS